MRFPLEQVSGSMMNEAADWANYSDLKLEPNRLWGSDILWLCCRRMWVHSPFGAGALVGVGCVALQGNTLCVHTGACAQISACVVLCAVCGFEWKRETEYTQFKSN